MKTYRFLRGLLKASAFATVMFVMQACYGAPHEPYIEDEEYEQMNDSIQEEPNLEVPSEIEAE